MIGSAEVVESIILESIKRGGQGIDYRTVEVPPGIKVEIKGKIVRVQGPKGTIEKDFTHLPVYMIRDGNRIIIAGCARKRKNTRYLGTTATKIKKMIEGVQRRYVYIHKVVFRHFPPRVEVDKENKRILIKGLYGRRDTIQVPIYGDVEVQIEYQAGSEIPDLVYLKGCDIEAVSLTSAALENACKLRGRYRKDIRVFFDGVWLWKRTMEE